MTIDTVSWRSIIGCFCSIRALPSRKNKLALLTIVFKYFIMCLLHIILCICKALVRYSCLVIYFTCLLVWCSHFCVAVRLFSLAFRFVRNHPLMFLLLCTHHWWTFVPILRDGTYIHIQVRPETYLNSNIGI